MTPASVPDASVPDASVPDESVPDGGWRLRRRLGRFFLVLALVLTVFAAALIVTSVNFVGRGNAVVYRWQPAVAAGERILTDLVDQETGVRGYLLTRQQAALAPYLRDRTLQHDDEGQLRALLGHDASTLSLFAALEQAAETWERRIAQPLIAQVGAGGTPSTAALDAGRARFDDIRTRAAALNSRLGLRADSAREARVRFGLVAAGVLMLLLVVLAATGAALWRGLHDWVLDPIDRLGRQTRTVAGGELAVTIAASGPRELLDLGADVEDMRARIVRELARAERIAADLRRRSVELERSNADLQQFAYVASHDLSEPLRKVANFCQLLERQYGPQLDDRARQYIDFAVDGAKRLQALITDLLALSRVGRGDEGFVDVGLDGVLDQALATLSDRIAASGAVIVRPTRLPVVPGDRSLLASLLENLVGNAIKYRRDDVAPVVTVTGERAAAGWSLAVTDNGIGIEPQYAERIFAVFQRLHLRDRYDGTGIGLALCRRIVEYHGGRIWLDTSAVLAQPAAGEPGSPGATATPAGATFRVTLPEGHSRAGTAPEPSV